MILLKLIILIAFFSRSVLTTSLHQFETVTQNCSGGSIPCGPGTSCCPSGYICNLKRGIPACENLAFPLISSFTGGPCVDPYLHDCSKVGIVGYCCPIGTVCFNNGVNKIVTCIDAYGTTAASYPSATSGVIPSSTPVPTDDPNIVYSPLSAWNNSSSIHNCTSSSLRSTSTINATVSFNYTGPSIMVHTVTSPQGGVFAVFVDGFNTTDLIDTFSGGDQQLPLCYPMQFPPFLVPPPDLESQDSHFITLIYTGPSPQAPNGTVSNVQFDSFAIPEFNLLPTKSGSSTVRREGGGVILLTFAISTIVITCIT